MGKNTAKFQIAVAEAFYKHIDLKLQAEASCSLFICRYVMKDIF